jgi:hypothetical protein
MNEKLLLAPAGWEQRFDEGVSLDIAEFSPSKIWIPYSNEYSERTASYRNKINQTAKKLGIEYVETPHSYHDAIALYQSLLVEFDTQVQTASSVRFHATTTPRDMIWYLLHFLSEKKVPTEFSYFRPLQYGSYLSRDAKSPNFVLKRSGIAFPDQPMCILALSGYDEERLSQLKQRYEPKAMLIGHQTGEQLENKKRNVFGTNEPTDGVKYFDFDCFDTSDNSVETLCAQIDSLGESYNVIAASLGPKPSALTLFKLTQLRPEIGLVYIPAGDYSAEYSTGIDIQSRTLANVF